ncbi:DoxX family protein [Dyadobacter sp. CY356]|uniref:DoxX family protein n=1 Tax=Dyadobacter sp. CY356 TaxID=2906442 RepID=UPI001F2BF66D|nr:DoxX family protein [Dyadobacter sp. CY356]MCF0058791.1 DoxX family protein [Dyadobacter sp. CY356]
MNDYQKSSKTRNTILWIAQILLAAFFIIGAVMKFMPIEKISVIMPWTGQVPVQIVRILGIIDLLAAAGLVLPPIFKIKSELTSWAAIGIVLMMICAVIFHVLRGEASVIGINLFCIVLACLVAWGRFRKGRIG